jgi:hypothetical protein
MKPIVSTIMLFATGCSTERMGAAQPQASPRETPTVRVDRPRLFLRPDQLANWQARFQQVPALQDVYSATRRDVLQRARPHDNPYVSAMELQCLALIYLAEGRATEPLAKAKQWMDHFAGPEGRPTLGDHWSHPLVTRAMSLAYDWLHPDLSQEERRRYGEAIIRYAEATLSYADHNAPGPNATWCNQVSDYFNQFYWHHGRIAFAGIALSGDPGFEQAAAKYLRLSEDWLKQHMLPATNQAGEGGGWFESLGYNQMTAAPFADLLEAWRTATGEDLFAQSKWLPGNCAWVLHSLIPHTGKYVPLDDIRPGAGPSAGQDAVGTFAPLLAIRYRDPYAQHFAQTLFPSQYGSMNFPYLLWYDPDVPTLDLAKAERGRTFVGLGQVNMRTGWGKDDTLAVYRAGRVYGGHGQYSAGHFLIYRKGHLLVEDGYYGVMGPEAHNTLYLGGEMRKLARSTHQHFLADMDGSTFDYGRITGYHQGADPQSKIQNAKSEIRYDWVGSDLTRAYTPEQAEQVTRRFVFLRPRTFVVIDYIRSPEGVEKRFRLHAPAAPQIDQATRTTWWQEGEGKLFVQTVLPADARLQATSGKESQLLTVSRPQPTREEVFLHVLHAAGLTESAPTVKRLEAGGSIGVQVEAPEGAWVVWLRPDGQPAPGITYAVESAGPVRHVVADLTPGDYRIRGTGVSTGSLRLADSAPAYFESAGGGRFDVAPVAQPGR